MEFGQFDPVGSQKLYKIEDEEPTVYMYDKKIQKISYIIANLAAVFEEWFLGFFDNEYFKTRRIQTQANFGDFKAFAKDIHRKIRPILVINPEIELVENHFYNETLFKLYNNTGSDDEFGARSLYSLPLIKTERCELSYRKNRYRMRFDIMMIERGLSRQIDLFNFMVMNFRHGSKFAMEKRVLNIIPLDYIHNIAIIHGMDFKSQEFIEFLNKLSIFPVVKRISPNGQYFFYMAQTVQIDVSIPDAPAKDGVDNIGAIERGARVVDRIEFELNLPAEFLLTVPPGRATPKFVKYDTPDNVYYIAPFKEQEDYPLILNGFTLTNVIDIAVQDESENELPLSTIVENIHDKIEFEIGKYVYNGLPISDVLRPIMYECGTKIPVDIVIENEAVRIVNPDFRKTYSLCTYVDLKKLNDINHDEFIKNIGTVTDYV